MNAALRKKNRPFAVFRRLYKNTGWKSCLAIKTWHGRVVSFGRVYARMKMRQLNRLSRCVRRCAPGYSSCHFRCYSSALVQTVKCSVWLQAIVLTDDDKLLRVSNLTVRQTCKAPMVLLFALPASPREWQVESVFRRVEGVSISLTIDWMFCSSC